MKHLYHISIGYVVTAVLCALMLGVSGARAQEILQATWQGEQIEYVDGQIAIKIRDGVSEQSAQSLIQQYGGSLIGEFTLRWGLAQFPAGTDIFALMNTLQNNSIIENVSPNGIIDLGFDPNDTFYQQGKQWALYNYGQSPPGGTSGADIKIRQAWDITRGSSNILIAIFDSGIPLINGQLSHPDLSNTARIKLGKDFIHKDQPGGLDEEYDPSVRDSLGHGTHVAGIVAAETNNGTGIAGVAGGCKILIQQTHTWNGNTTSSVFLKAVKAAVDSGARIINYSAGSETNFPQYDTAIQYAEAHNTIIVTITHNDQNEDCTIRTDRKIRYPAKLSTLYSNVIAVGATTHEDKRACYSNVGAEINVVAPGGRSNSLTDKIYSTLPNYTHNPYYSDAQNYGYIYATSMAAPHVAGVAGLMLSVNPSLTPSQVRNILQSTADDVNSAQFPGFDTLIGHGRINAYHALQEAFLQCGPPQNLVADSVKVNTSPTPFRVRLKWRTHPCATSYKVYRKGWGTYEFVNIATVSQPDTTYIDMDVPWAPSIGEENPIHYYVTALSSSLESDSSNNVSANCAFCLEPPKSHPSIEKEKPTLYALLPNYPNPFNPVTQIKYALPEDIHVALKVYDVLGREVAKLVDEFQEAGYKEVNFNASALPSGIYVYKMHAGKFSQVRKMMLIK